MKKKILGSLFSLLGFMAFSQILVNEGFEDPGIPAGWTYSKFNKITSSNGYPCTGDGAVLSSLSNTSTTSSITYSSSNSNGNDIAVSFKYRAEGGNTSNPVVTGNIKAEYSSNNGATYNLIGSPISVSGSFDCSSFTGTIPTGAIPVGSGFKFRITANNEGNGYWILTIDDIMLTQTATCNVPAFLNVTNVTSTTVQVNWSSVTTPGNGFEIYYNTTGTAPNSSTTPLVTNVSGTSSILDSLLSNKTYYVWVRSNCGSIISAWSSVKIFATPCGIYSLPYNENFETTNSSSIPVCSSLEGTQWWTYPIDPSLGFSQGQVMRSSPNGSWWYTPPVNLQGGTTYVVRFKRGNDNVLGSVNQRLKIAYGTAPNSSSMINIITDITEPIYSNISYDVFYFTPSLSGAYNLGFNSYLTPGTTIKASLYIDDLNIDIAPSCRVPKNISVSSITETTADISWEAPDNVPAGGYDLYYSMRNTPPTSSTVPNDQGVFGLSKSISSLLPGKKYYIWIRSRCSSSEVSDWKGMVFSTTCPAFFSVPYTEDFDNSFSAGGSIPNCTTGEKLLSGGNNWEVQHYYQASGFWPGKALFLFFFSNASTSAWFYTQGIYLEAGKQYKMTYLYGNSNYQNRARTRLKVAYGTAQNSTSMTKTLFEYQGIPSLTQNAGEHSFTVPVSGVYYFGFNGYTAYDYNDYLAIDNISIVEKDVLAVKDMVIAKDNKTVYPNPFKDVLYLSDDKDIRKINVNDASGQLVKSLGAVKELHLETLNSGIYMISLEYKDGTSKVFKVIKD